MTKVFVVRTVMLTQELLRTIANLLAELGYELVLIDPGVPGSPPADFAPNETLLVLIDPSLDGDGPACEVIRKAGTGGCAIFGMWPPGPSDGALPAIVQTFVTGGIVNCDRDALKSVFQAPIGETWKQPGGQDRPTQNLDRGGC